MRAPGDARAAASVRQQPPPGGPKERCASGSHGARGEGGGGVDGRDKSPARSFTKLVKSDAPGRGRLRSRGPRAEGDGLCGALLALRVVGRLDARQRGGHLRTKSLIAVRHGGPICTGLGGDARLVCAREGGWGRGEGRGVSD